MSRPPPHVVRGNFEELSPANWSTAEACRSTGTTKRCARCGLVKDYFARNPKSRDGLHSWCADCQRDYARGRPTDPVRRRRNARASDRRHPDRRRAREKVKYAVRCGELPPISTRFCVECGAPADAYDHCAGYERPLEVEPVCHECHGRRSRRRGEHRRVRAAEAA